MQYQPFKSVYLHFPFCESKCHYCDFYSIGREKTKAGEPERFEQTLIQEIEMRADRGEIAPTLDTLFMGGGTPSMTPPDSMKRICDTLFRHTRITEKTEWTMEANPSSISLEQFKAYRDLGLNRVSMGVQSLRNDHLLKLGRVHDESAALRSLETLFEAGITNVSTDLLCGVPGQSLDDVQHHLKKLTSYPIRHLSIYLLTLPPHHRMYPELPKDEEQLQHLLLIDRFMRSVGFEHYEVSNFAKPGFRARHNLGYWTGKSYLGFGPSAHSYSSEARARFKNFSSIHRYSEVVLGEKKLPVESTEELTDEQIDLEKWMLAIRLEEGFPKAWLATERQEKVAAHLLSTGLLEHHPQILEHLRATPHGFALSDTLIRELS